MKCQSETFYCALLHNFRKFSTVVILDFSKIRGKKLEFKFPAKKKLNCKDDYSGNLLNCRSAMGNPNRFEGQIYAKMSCRGPK
jgi:hypothetical protein